MQVPTHATPSRDIAAYFAALALAAASTVTIIVCALAAPGNI